MTGGVKSLVLRVLKCPISCKCMTDKIVTVVIQSYRELRLLGNFASRAEHNLHLNRNGKLRHTVFLACED